jgi:hypothetical protein
MSAFSNRLFGNLTMYKDRVTYWAGTIELLGVLALDYKLFENSVFFGVSAQAWIIMGAFAFLLFLFFDIRYIYPAYLNKQTEMNPYMGNMVASLADMSSRLAAIEEELCRKKSIGGV